MRVQVGDRFYAVPMSAWDVVYECRDDREHAEREARLVFVDEEMKGASNTPSDPAHPSWTALEVRLWHGEQLLLHWNLR